MEYIPYTQIASRLDIKQGDILLVSSDILRLALVAAEHKERFSASLFIRTFTDAVGEQGTLLFPTYNWDFCRGQAFDYHKTPCMTGSLGKEALKTDGFLRTAHPIYSFAVWGKDRDMLCAMSNTKSFGADSPFAYLHHHGKNLLIDVSLKNSFTFVHYVEERVGVTYRYQKKFSAEYTDSNGNTDIRSYSMFVRDLERDVANVVDPVGDDMKAAGKLKENFLNGICFSMLRFSDFYEFAKRDIIENKAKKLASYIGQEEDLGSDMYRLAEKLFPLCRSLTGEGVRQTLNELKKIVPSLTVHEVPSGTKAFDWTVPKEWVIRDAYIEDVSAHGV